MSQAMITVLASVVLVFVPFQATAVVLSTGRSPKLREAATSLVIPLAYEQRLLVCNAYPSNMSMSVSKNEREELAGKQDPIAFRQCRYMSTHVQEHDKLAFHTTDEVVEGTFQVGALPKSDSVLLLVLGKRPASPMLSFSSFAFPASNEKHEALVAVIDASGSSASTRLRVEGHTTSNAKKKVEAKHEELNFNRVYMIAEGTYDASVLQPIHTNVSNVSTLSPVLSKKQFRFAGSGNYVLLNTGDDGQFPQTLTVFPEEPLLPQSAAWPQAFAQRSLLGLAFLVLLTI